VRKLTYATIRAFGVAACGLAAWSLYEPFRFRLRRLRLTMTGAPPLRILHVSDLHMAPRHKALQRWLRSVPDQVGEPPDLVIATGDLVEGNEGIDAAVAALSPLRARLGRYYVLGSHDYFVPSGMAYTKYFTGKRPVRAPRLDTIALEERLRAEGWADLSNKEVQLERDGVTVRVSGVDDPYLGRDDTRHVHRSGNDALAIGIVHTPDVVSEFALSGYDVVLAGHTHAGQVRIPFVGALVTNCSLPAALAGGLHRVGSTWLHVSPGLGTGKFTPIRFNCPPEATLLTIGPD
jgi:predicted MPP superfamily phosphohydrolase